MVFGKRKKFINIMSKNFFIFWVILKSHVMMIALGNQLFCHRHCDSGTKLDQRTGGDTMV